MRPESPWPSLLLVLALAAGFVLYTADSLPPLVASHFAGGGAANGFMPHDAYVALMLALVVGLPLLLAALTGLSRYAPVERMNLPNRDYWLAPEREAETLAYLAGRGAGFAKRLAVFLAFVHWLVVKANAGQPPHFPEALFFAGLAVFVAALVLWLAGFVAHFRRPG
ncbi:MAG TPA: hypothetical protein VMB75_00380 [Rhodocyclaceae bacterium]|nr:hypothetical protein [Rhodocyclaceae bacterium]